MFKTGLSQVSQERCGVLRDMGQRQWCPVTSSSLLSRRTEVDVMRTFPRDRSGDPLWNVHPVLHTALGAGWTRCGGPVPALGALETQLTWDFHAQTSEASSPAQCGNYAFHAGLMRR